MTGCLPYTLHPFPTLISVSRSHLVRSADYASFQSKHTYLQRIICLTGRVHLSSYQGESWYCMSLPTGMQGGMVPKYQHGRTYGIPRSLASQP